MTNIGHNVTDNSVMKLTSRHSNGRHASRPKQDLIFAPPHDKKIKKEKGQPPLNFLSGFLCPASFSTFASRAFLFLGKFKNKKCTPFGKFAKELNSTRKTKTPAKKFSFAPTSWNVLCLLINQTTLYFNDS
ncbi:hypothetical protein FLAV_00786 [Flavobacteriales bacterium]|nr:hypothetical protein FLAV_00786 [Flavobacteriales bacterium]